MKMSIKEYFKSNKQTAILVLVICFIIFNVIFGLIAIAVSLKPSEQMNPLSAVVISIICGIIMSCFIAVLSFFSSLYVVRQTLIFYDQIPNQIKSAFLLKVVNVPNNHKVKFSEFSIISENKDPFIIRAIGRKEIWITLINNFIEISNIPLLIKAVNKKYQKENIIVSQFGLMKKVKVNGWNSISFEELNDIILQLKKISADENIRVYSR